MLDQGPKHVYLYGKHEKFGRTLIIALGKQCSKTNTAFLRNVINFILNLQGELCVRGISQDFTKVFHEFEEMLIFMKEIMFLTILRDSLLLTLNSPEVGSGAE